MTITDHAERAGEHLLAQMMDRAMDRTIAAMESPPCETIATLAGTPDEPAEDHIRNALQLLMRPADENPSGPVVMDRAVIVAVKRRLRMALAKMEPPRRGEMPPAPNHSASFGELRDIGRA